LSSMILPSPQTFALFRLGGTVPTPDKRGDF
jgi:hypothetical protein